MYQSYWSALDHGPIGLHEDAALIIVATTEKRDYNVEMACVTCKFLVNYMMGTFYIKMGIS